MFGGILIELYWAPGSLNPADLSSKVHANLAKVLNSSFYRAGHSFYSAEFSPPEAILFATVHSGVFKFRGLQSLSNHTSSCNCCSTQFSQKVGELLVHHTEVLGNKSEIDTSLVSQDGPKSHSAILEDANEILRAKNCETASVGQSVGKSASVQLIT